MRDKDFGGSIGNRVGPGVNLVGNARSGGIARINRVPRSPARTIVRAAARFPYVVAYCHGANGPRRRAQSGAVAENAQRPQGCALMRTAVRVAASGPKRCFVFNTTAMHPIWKTRERLAKVIARGEVLQTSMRQGLAVVDDASLTAWRMNA
ncbi:MAG TPA: hypothetical protein VHB97_07635, partial [Polyangia bacterium]|nr:hypothetical protein [Polyangia bacterium]